MKIEWAFRLCVYGSIINVCCLIIAKKSRKLLVSVIIRYSGNFFPFMLLNLLIFCWEHQGCPGFKTRQYQIAFLLNSGNFMDNLQIPNFSKIGLLYGILREDMPLFSPQFTQISPCIIYYDLLGVCLVESNSKF